MNGPQLALRTLLVGIVAILVLVALVYTANQLSILFTGLPLVQINTSGEFVWHGRVGSCLLEAWGCHYRP